LKGEKESQLGTAEHGRFCW